jgi:hypothetical protein
VIRHIRKRHPQLQEDIFLKLMFAFRGFLSRRRRVTAQLVRQAHAIL